VQDLDEQLIVSLNTGGIAVVVQVFALNSGTMCTTNCMICQLDLNF
jgi:hypothetical protein